MPDRKTMDLLMIKGERKVTSAKLQASSVKEIQPEVV